MKPDKAAFVFNSTFWVAQRIIACLLVIGFGILLGFVIAFLPVAMLVNLANQQTEKTQISNTYNSLMRRYYNNTLFSM